MENLLHIIYIDRHKEEILYDLKLEEDTIPNLQQMRQSFIDLNLAASPKKRKISIKEEELFKAKPVISDEESEDEEEYLPEEEIVIFF